MQLFEWMARSAVLTALLGVAAWALDDVLHTRQRATRFVWVGALLLSIALPAITMLAPDVWPEWLKRSSGAIVLPEVQTTFVESVSVSAPAAGANWSPRDFALGLWFSATVLLALRWVHGWLKVRVVRERAREVILSGERVLIADKFGPAVIGLRRPRVVMPSWLLLGDADRQRMIVRHEVEHTRAGDHWLLAIAPILVALFPWNAALWWQLQRLRLAVELDCDARVLRGGVPALDYGSMLLDVAGGITVLQPTLAALSEPRTSLERRIRAMTPVRYRYALARATSFIALAALTVAGALTAAAPAAQPVIAQERPVRVEQSQDGPLLIVLNGKMIAPTEKLDLADLEVATIEVLKPADALKKYGDRGKFGALVVTTRARTQEGVSTTKPAQEPPKLIKEVPRKAPLEEPAATGIITGRVIIAETGEPAVGAQISIDNFYHGAVTDANGRFVIREVPAGARTLDIRTKGYSGKQEISVKRDMTTTVSEIPLKMMSALEMTKFEKGQPGVPTLVEKVKAAVVMSPLIILDGVWLGNDTGWLKDLDPAVIDRVEVLKGPTAVDLYGERARDGVILIFTKR
jgi:hypothetical protein